MLDLSMPHISGIEILDIVREEYPEMPVIIVTGKNEVGTAVDCMQKGAFDYMVKPVERSRLVSGVKRAIEIRDLRGQTRVLRKCMLAGKLQKPEVFSAIITDNSRMHKIFQYLESIARSEEPILVTGETGVGKELIVKAIHSFNDHCCPLVSVNVAGLDDTVFCDTLFGHVRGAFTGATEMRQGLVEKASSGILHLDEIGDLGNDSQVKLLRLLQEGEFFKLGTDRITRSDTRVVATTNHNLRAAMEAREFRRDLYYRLSAHHIHIPPLRERPEDISLLLDHFLSRSTQLLGKKQMSFGKDLVEILSRYTFPGNVREMKLMIHDAVCRSSTSRLASKLILDQIEARSSRVVKAQRSEKKEYGLPTMKDGIRILIEDALRHCGNNKSEAARRLEISRQRLARHLRE